MSGDLLQLRCPNCGRLLAKCAEENRKEIEILCGRCKRKIRFVDLLPESARRPFDRHPALV